MRMHFNDLFTVSNGMISPKVPVALGPAFMTPGVSMAIQGVQIGGVDMSQLVGKYLEVNISDGYHHITGIYPY